MSGTPPSRPATLPAEAVVTDFSVLTLKHRDFLALVSRRKLSLYRATS
jgi:hypothetical protein